MNGNKTWDDYDDTNGMVGSNPYERKMFKGAREVLKMKKREPSNDEYLQGIADKAMNKGGT